VVLDFLHLLRLLHLLQHLPQPCLGLDLKVGWCLEKLLGKWGMKFQERKSNQRKTAMKATVRRIQKSEVL
jgi:hypothetical protein